ncbi:flagellar biosynthesis anti-sigma factor FlgM [Caldimonas brevitalea]|uniref:Negative regulator of flagellin synthesis n=1 Tax=Caldimonas brevitalea TaxID=413882 RepID=A0A0G3BSJ7_9BURK|nr:flagellar biosynthesis anti-sigma factor FlgM [Caldimonas brevitalea]AKJ30978.1 negative regulator of flagellin synthesis FlgM [Caldimonas brevitalea]
MKIGNHIETPSLTATPSATQRTASGDAAANAAAPKPAAAPAAGSTESATVKLSSTAASLMSGNAEFDVDKVNAMKQAIANGTFRVNPEVIADKLIANARELLDRTAH